MSKGFLLFAENNDKVNYVKQAYALALSIKSSQPNYSSVSLVTNDPVPEKYKSVFDNIIPIPWITSNISSPFRSENRWKLFHVSPYDETMVLDSDMLLTDDITVWWEHCGNSDLKFCSHITNYRGERIVDTVHRLAFINNDLPSPYIALHYFKKSQLALDFYKTLEFVINNWEWHYAKYAPKNAQSWLSMDVATAITIELMGIHEQVIDTHCPLEFTHMKPAIQGWHNPPKKWTSAVHYLLDNNGKLIISNIKQKALFHYIEKDFITDAMIIQLEELANV